MISSQWVASVPHAIVVRPQGLSRLREISRRNYALGPEGKLLADTEPASGGLRTLKIADGVLVAGVTLEVYGRTWCRQYRHRRQIWKTSCSISGATSTTIARIAHGKGKRRIHPRHHQSPISARLVGNLIADPYIRRQWLPDYSRSLRHPVNLCKTWNEIIRCLHSWLQRVSRI